MLGSPLPEKVHAVLYCLFEGSPWAPHPEWDSQRAKHMGLVVKGSSVEKKKLQWIWFLFVGLFGFGFCGVGFCLGYFFCLFAWSKNEVYATSSAGLEKEGHSGCFKGQAR